MSQLQLMTEALVLHVQVAASGDSSNQLQVGMRKGVMSVLLSLMCVAQTLPLPMVQ